VGPKPRALAERPYCVSKTKTTPTDMTSVAAPITCTQSILAMELSVNLALTERLI
jgi:hypothetical protein